MASPGLVALLSLGMWQQVMPPWQAFSVVAAMSVVSGVQSLWLIRAELGSPSWHTNRRRGLGIHHCATAEIGICRVYVALWSVLRISPIIAPSGATNAKSRCGDWFLRGGGGLGGAASLSGALPTMWCAMQPWTKGEISAVLRPYNVVILVVAVAVFA